ncbi:MAG: HAMP domain-containing sensor histidine kinase [Candidatus Berkelbacteria bacterium]|nr:HAMP domain-containing sensor histidine kinase [Candidatus Berkelbacteria bacterium]
MFKSTYLKLTLFYVAVIMVISVGFSLAIFSISSNEIDRGLNRQDTIIQNLPPRNDSHLFDDFINLRQQQLDDSTNRLTQNLIYFNLLILILSTIASYFFARWTLRPLEEAMEEQSQFTADASHELRTPLAAIKLEIEVGLRDKKFDFASARKILQSNLEEVGKLESLSSTLLRLAKLDEVEKLDFSDLNLADVVTEAYEKVEVLAKKRSIKFVTDFQNAEIRGDQTMLTELFVILFDNAIKYSPAKSKIKVSVTSGKNPEVLIKDSGIGIAPKELLHIFDRFYRADSARSKEKVDGFGLGLSIAKRIVELHGGEISAKSNVGNGSEFKVEL